MLLHLVVHFCRGRRVGKYSTPTYPKLVCHLLYLPPMFTSITIVMILVRLQMPLIVMRREIDLLNRHSLTALVHEMSEKFQYPLTTK